MLYCDASYSRLDCCNFKIFNRIKGINLIKLLKESKLKQLTVLSCPLGPSIIVQTPEICSKVPINWKINTTFTVPIV